MLTSSLVIIGLGECGGGVGWALRERGKQGAARLCVCVCVSVCVFVCVD